MDRYQWDYLRSPAMGMGWWILMDGCRWVQVSQSLAPFPYGCFLKTPENHRKCGFSSKLHDFGGCSNASFHLRKHFHSCGEVRLPNIPGFDEDYFPVPNGSSNIQAIGRSRFLFSCFCSGGIGHFGWEKLKIHPGRRKKKDRGERRVEHEHRRGAYGACGLGRRRWSGKKLVYPAW